LVIIDRLMFQMDPKRIHFLFSKSNIQRKCSKKDLTVHL
jgi:hypothetical protein